MFTIRDPNTKNYLRCLLLGGWFSNRGKGLKSSHFVCSDKVAMGVDPGENPPMDRVGSAPQNPGASNSPEHISFIQFQLWSTKTYLCYLCKQFLIPKSLANILNTVKYHRVVLIFSWFIVFKWRAQTNARSCQKFRGAGRVSSLHSLLRIGLVRP